MNRIKKKIAIVGSGDLGQQIAYHAINDDQYNVVGYFDDFTPKNSIVKGIKVLGKLSEIQENFDSAVFDMLLIGIGYKHLGLKEKLFNSLKNKVKFGTLIHSSCYVDESCKIGEGVCMLPGSVVDQNAVIENNVLVNIGCKIAHNTVIKAHSFLAPSVTVSGYVVIGKKCNIGVNTILINNVAVAEDVQTGGGTVVIKDIIKKGLYVGNPARFIR